MKISGEMTTKSSKTYNVITTFNVNTIKIDAFQMDPLEELITSLKLVFLFLRNLIVLHPARNIPVVPLKVESR